MTEAEKKEIVALVMAEISGQSVDFDLQTVTPQRTDILPAVRPDGEGGYTGVTLDWGGITDELTTQAKGFRDEALQAKKDTDLLKSETNDIKSNVEDIYRQFNEAVDKTIESVRNVYQSDLNAESTARQTADNTLQQNIDSEASTRAEADTAIGARIDSETTTRESEVAELERVNAIQKYEIENLKAKAEGQIYRTEIVDTEAYSLDVPSSVSPYAEVQKIRGKSVVWNQFEKGINGYGINNTTSSVLDNGYRLTSPNSIFQFISPIDKTFSKEHKYLLILDINGTHSLNTNANNQLIIYDGAVKQRIYFSPVFGRNFVLFQCIDTFERQSIQYQLYPTTGDSTLYLDITNMMDFDLTQMFGSGNEPTLEECQKIFSADYYPYDAGSLKSFPVQRVVSKGRNLWDEESEDTGYILSDGSVQIGYSTRYASKNFIPIEPNVQYFFSVGYSISNYGIRIAWYDSDKKFISVSDYYTSTPISPSNARYMKFNVHTQYGSESYKGDCLVQLASVSDITYTPYREPVVLDFSSVTTDLKSAGSVADEWINGKVTKRIGVVDLGVFSWNYVSQYDTFWTSIYNNKTIYGDCITALFKTSKVYYTNAEMNTCGFFLDTNSMFGVKTDKYTDVDTFKQAMSGVMLYYELAEPTEETIPEIDNYLEVEGGGTLTFESDETIHMPVPSTNRFVVDLT